MSLLDRHRRWLRQYTHRDICHYGIVPVDRICQYRSPRDIYDHIYKSRQYRKSSNSYSYYQRHPCYSVSHHMRGWRCVIYASEQYSDSSSEQYRYSQLSPSRHAIRYSHNATTRDDFSPQTQDPQSHPHQSGSPEK